MVKNRKFHSFCHCNKLGHPPFPHYNWIKPALNQFIKLRNCQKGVGRNFDLRARRKVSTGYSSEMNLNWFVELRHCAVSIEQKTAESDIILD